MKMLQTGDACPICGQPIRTKDPNKLIFLSAMAWWDEQNVDCDPDLCDGIVSTRSTNVDKVRSLPDDELAGLLMCPEGVGDFIPSCRELTGNEDAPQLSCTQCTLDWAAAPYSGWDDE